MGRDALSEICAECGKAITDSEWITNWTSCAECFDKGYVEYLKSEKEHGWGV